MTIRIIEENISRIELADIAKNQFGDFVKAVVDVGRGIMAIGSELHADGEAALIEWGSDGKNLWGINLHPAHSGDDFVEFNSMINIRPSQGNRSRGVENHEMQKKIKEIVKKLVWG